MKYGYRMPNVKKSVSARTTGKISRSINKTTNPLYGKKGIGYINNPQKAIYNKVYNKTTKDTFANVTKSDIVSWIVVLIVAIPFIWIIWKILSFVFWIIDI